MSVPPVFHYKFLEIPQKYFMNSTANLPKLRCKFLEFLLQIKLKLELDLFITNCIQINFIINVDMIL